MTFLSQVKSSGESKKSVTKEKPVSDSTKKLLDNSANSKDSSLNSLELDLKQELKTAQEQIEHLRQRCERAERFKSDALLRRVAALDTSSSRTSASEVYS